VPNRTSLRRLSFLGWSVMMFVVPDNGPLQLFFEVTAKNAAASW
jgi:hypothetical protein